MGKDSSEIGRVPTEGQGHVPAPRIMQQPWSRSFKDLKSDPTAIEHIKQYRTEMKKAADLLPGYAKRLLQLGNITIEFDPKHRDATVSGPVDNGRTVGLFIGKTKTVYLPAITADGLKINQGGIFEHEVGHAVHFLLSGNLELKPLGSPSQWSFLKPFLLAYMQDLVNLGMVDTSNAYIAHFLPKKLGGEHQNGFHAFIEQFAEAWMIVQYEKTNRILPTDAENFQAMFPRVIAEMKILDEKCRDIDSMYPDASAFQKAISSFSRDMLREDQSLSSPKPSPTRMER